MWPIVNIGDVCDLATGGTPSRSKKEYFDNGKIKWLVSGDIHKKEIHDCEGRITQAGLDNSSAKYLPLNSVMIALNGQGKTRGTVALLKAEATCNQSLVSINPKDQSKLLPEYLYANLNGRYEEIRKITGDGGNDRRGLNMPLIRKISFPLAPIEEQKRIIEFLDKTFAEIDQTIENTEKNLANTQELFESYLNNVFSGEHADWIAEKLISITSKIGSGSTPKGGSASYKKQGISLIRSLNVYDRWFKEDKLAFIDDVQAKKLSNVVIEENDVLFNITGASIARCCIVPDQYLPARVNQHVSILRANSDRVNSDFLCYLMTSRFYKDKLLGIGEEGGSTRQAITKKQLQELIISYPESIQQQNEIVVKLDRIQEISKKLEKKYMLKLKSLQELKQSILQKAFSGELTADVVDTTTPEYAANVIAVAFDKHELAGKQKTFGHVKTQKILHLTESVAGINLGREPKKDAAGPNDFAHMLSATEWAENNDFFKFLKRRDGGHDFVRLPQFKERLKKASQSLKNHKEQLSNVINLFVPMKTEKAEVLATVHAAWNNLLLDDKQPSDEEIVYEARENWHADKLNIERNKFFDAIKLIRKENIIPQGVGKRVSG